MVRYILNWCITCVQSSISRVRKSGTLCPCSVTNFSHYCCPLRQYDVFWAQRSTDRCADRTRCTHKRVYRATGKCIVGHWTSKEATLRHSSGWGTWSVSPQYRDLRTRVLYTQSIHNFIVFVAHISCCFLWRFYSCILFCSSCFFWCTKFRVFNTFLRILLYSFWDSFEWRSLLGAFFIPFVFFKRLHDIFYSCDRPSNKLINFFQWFCPSK